MLIPLSIGSLRIACAAARTHAVESSTADRGRLWKTTYDQLLEGAIHNGLKATDDDRKAAHGMADRDVEHAMESHPSHYIIKHIDTMLEMAGYVDQSEDTYEEVVIDTLEFQLLKDHLPSTKKD